ncbi:THAP domain-containing protein 9, partial [Stegodyphus mimosarum]
MVSLTQTEKTDETGAQELPSANSEDQRKEAFKTPETHSKVYTPKSLKIKRLTSQVSYLKRKYCRDKKSLADILKVIQPMVSPVIYSFIKGQLKASSLSKYGQRLSLEDKNLCLQIYLSSPKAYDTLKAFFNLPSKPTLRKSISGIYLEPGFSAAVLQFLRLVVSKLKCQDKYCILSFDEMTLKRGLLYDKKNDRIVGFENYGSYSKPTVIP